MAVNEPLPGTSDLWEPEVLDWINLENQSRNIFARYGYAELRTPIFERTDVFVRNLGNETDVVQKEMYTFQDRGGRSLTLRPEGTAGVMRAIANKGLEQGEEARVFYFGPMFRGERPAAGRRRQFHQIGVEAVGSNSPWMDAECIAMLVHFLAELGIRGSRVLLNTRGLPEDRQAISQALLDYFQPHSRELCEDCQRRLSTNVWRMLDCKNPACHEIALGAPQILSLMGETSRTFFAQVCAGLTELGVEYELAPRMVRGLDYYVHTVFEITHPGLGAQDALAGGGRYRISLPGDKRTFEGIGFAAGMERLLLARESLGLQSPPTSRTDTYIVSLGAPAIPVGLRLAGELRQAGLGGRVKADFSNRSLKAQMRSANRENASRVLILGVAELSQGSVICRNMTTSAQVTLPTGELQDWFLQA
ncbi:MAG: histidine--tRNA ligase [Oligosphaeraceae bacterium]|nr:histidine--tRNA ligase [Oligosphaeraceae bacterium]